MKGDIQFEYIAPYTSRQFSTSSNIGYILALVGLDPEQNRIIVSKFQIKNIGNISGEIKGFTLKMAFPLVNIGYLNVMLFELNSSTNLLSLLFADAMSLEDYEYAGINYITLREPPYVNNLPRSTQYVGDMAFLQEQFYHYERMKSSESFVVLFFKKVYQSDFPKIAQIAIKFDRSAFLAVYDRYHDMIIKESTPNIDQRYMPLYELQAEHIAEFIKTYCLTNNYAQYVIDYQKDLTDLVTSPTNNFIERLPIHMRPLKQDEYMNNVLTTPVDSRVRGFQINTSTKFNIYGQTYYLKNLVAKPEQLLGGAGLFCRMNPLDYRRAFTPYRGYLTEIASYTGATNSIVLKYESSYFMPPTVHERDLAAAIYGNFINMTAGVGAGNRSNPDVLDVQPNTYLIFYVVLMGSFQISNPTIQTLLKAMPANTNYQIKPTWIEQGEEIGYWSCADGTVIFLTNRPIVYTKDVDYYSRINKPNTLAKTIDVFVKARDMVGSLY